MSLPKVFFWVFFIHVLVLFLLYVQKGHVFVSPKKIVVSTVVFKKPQEKIVTHEKANLKTTAKKEISVKNEVVKKVEKKPALEKERIVPYKKLEEKKQNSPVREIKKNVIRSEIKNNKNEHKKNTLKEEISNLEKFSLHAESPQEKKELPVPKIGALKIPTIDINPSEEKEDLDNKGLFQNVLVEYFRQNLSLPEYGEVKIKLTLNCDGTIADIFIVSSKSKKNEEYLKNTLPNLAFPWFNLYLPNEKNLGLTVSFLNDI